MQRYESLEEVSIQSSSANIPFEICESCKTVPSSPPLHEQKHQPSGAGDVELCAVLSTLCGWLSSVGEKLAVAALCVQLGLNPCHTLLLFLIWVATHRASPTNFDTLNSASNTRQRITTAPDALPSNPTTTPVTMKYIHSSEILNIPEGGEFSNPGHFGRGDGRGKKEVEKSNIATRPRNSLRRDLHTPGARKKRGVELLLAERKRRLRNSDGSWELRGECLETAASRCTALVLELGADGTS